MMILCSDRSLWIQKYDDDNDDGRNVSDYVIPVKTLSTGLYVHICYSLLDATFSLLFGRKVEEKAYRHFYFLKV